MIQIALYCRKQLTHLNNAIWSMINKFPLPPPPLPHSHTHTLSHTAALRGVKTSLKAYEKWIVSQMPCLQFRCADLWQAACCEVLCNCHFAVKYTLVYSCFSCVRDYSIICDFCFPLFVWSFLRNNQRSAFCWRRGGKQLTTWLVDGWYLYARLRTQQSTESQRIGRCAIWFGIKSLNPRATHMH